MKFIEIDGRTYLIYQNNNQELFIIEATKIDTHYSSMSKFEEKVINAFMEGD